MTPKEIKEVADRAIDKYRGNVNPLQQAIGMMFTTEQIGWRALYLMHDRRTINRAEKILGIKFQEEFDEEGPLVHKSVAWKALKHMQDFWKAVRGEIKGVRSTELK